MHIIVLIDEKRDVRLVCRKWRDAVDHCETPFSPDYYITREDLVLLNTPKDDFACEGCLSWCRRNGRHLRAVHMKVDSPWWLLPISPLRQLRNVTYLVISGSSGLQPAPELRSLHRLAPLEELQHLRLQNLPVTSLESLTLLTGLKHLDLMECPDVVDMHSLQQLTSLTHFAVMLCGGTMLDLELLAPLTQLQSLLTDTQDIYGLSNLVNLATLTWHNEDGVDDEEQLLQLKSLPKLTNLSLELWQLHQPEFLQSTSLTALELWDVPETGSMKDHLRGVPQLRELSFRCCSMRDLSGLSALRHLEVLDVREDNVELDANTLRGLTQLKTLYISSYNYERPRVDLSALKEAGVEFMLDVIFR